MRGNGYAARPPKGAPRGRQAAARGSPFAQVPATASQRRSPNRASSGGERSGGGRIGWRLSAFAVSSEEKCRGRHRSERRRPEREAVPQESELRRLDPEVAAQALAPQAALLADADPIGLIDAMTDLTGRAHAACASSVALRFGTDLGLPGVATGLRRLGVPVPGRIAPQRRDRRFKDPAWERYPWCFALQQSYLLWSRSMLEFVDAARLDGSEKLRSCRQRPQVSS